MNKQTKQPINSNRDQFLYSMYKLIPEERVKLIKGEMRHKFS